MKHFLAILISILICSELQAQINPPPNDPCDLLPNPGTRWSTEPGYYNANPGSFIHIPASETIYLDETTVDLGGLWIEGTLVFTDCTANPPKLRSTWIVVTGTLQIGNSVDGPLNADALITLVSTVTPQVPSIVLPPAGLNPANPEVFQFLEDRGLVVTGSGKLVAYGEDKGTSWCQLEETLRGSLNTTPSQQTLVNVSKDVSKWKQGDGVVIASTDFDWEQAEWRQLAADGTSNMELDFGLSSTTLEFDHWGATEYGKESTNDWPFDQKAEIGLLTRSVIIRGQDDDNPDWENHYGHVAFLLEDTNNSSVAPKAELSWIKFHKLGVEGKRGRYPLHIHQVGAVPMNPTLNKPDIFIENCSFHDCFNHFAAIHNTQGVLLQSNVGYLTKGHGFFLEDEFATENLILDNLGLGTQPPDEDVIPDTIPAGDERVAADNDEPAVFWWVSPDNWIEGNHAAGSDAHGFWIDPLHGETHTHKVEMGSQSDQTSSFIGNWSHSNEQHGFYQDDHDVVNRANPDWQVIDPPSLEDFFTYKNRRYGVWYRAHGRSYLSGMNVADSRAGFYLASDGRQTAGLSHTTLYNSLVIGETSNQGMGQYDYMEDMADGYPDRDRPDWEFDAMRSLPQYEPFFDDPQNDPHKAAWDTLVGVEFYDGFLEVEDTNFANFYDIDLRDDAQLIHTRYAAVASQVAYDSAFAEDPRNRVRGLSGDSSLLPSTPNHGHGVYFRPTDPPEANMLRNTIIYDEDGSLGEGANTYFTPRNPFLVANVSNVTTRDHYHAISTADVDYAQFTFESLSFPVSSTVNCIEVEVGIDTSATGTVQQVHKVPNSTATDRQFPFNAAVEPSGSTGFREYTIQFLDDNGNPASQSEWPANFRLVVRFSEMIGNVVYVKIPLANAPTPITGVGFSDGAFLAGEYQSYLNGVNGASEPFAWYYDDQADVIYLKLTSFLNPNEPVHNLFWDGTESWATISTQ